MLSNQIKICDPLYDYIYLEAEENKILNHPAFTRLRSILQLGFSDLAFPSANHTRFTHSLGACHLAGQAFDSIFSENTDILNDVQKKIFRKWVRIAALLHDVGHGPLSHSSESLMPNLDELGLQQYLNSSKRKARHEDYTLKFIMEAQGLNSTLKEIGLEPLAIAQILHPEFCVKTNFFESAGINFLPVLRQIVNSAFDVDRMDYLYRDSLSCGVKYGLIDFAWLLAHFDYVIKENQVFLAIDSSAIYTLESLLLGRQHMRLIVYFHHKSAIYNQMLKNYSKECNWVLPSILEDYIEFTDTQLFQKLKSDSNPWAKRIVERKAYVRLYESTYIKGSNESKQAVDFLINLLKKEAIDFIVIDSKNNSIKPSKNLPHSFPIYLKNKALGKTQVLSEVRGFLSLPDRRLERIYVKPVDLDKAKELLKKSHF